MKHRLFNALITGIIIIFACSIQSFMAEKSNIVTPNLLMMVTSIFGYMRGRNYGMLTGFVCGLFVDVMFGDVIGLCALIYMIAGYFAGLFRRMFYSDKVFMPMSIVFICDFIYNILFYIIRFVLRNKLDFLYYLRKVIVPEMVITAFVALILYKAFYVLNEKYLNEKQESLISFD